MMSSCRCERQSCDRTARGRSSAWRIQDFILEWAAYQEFGDYGIRLKPGRGSFFNFEHLEAFYSTERAAKIHFILTLRLHGC